MENKKRIRRKTKVGNALGEVLRELRIKKEWSQEELAFEADLERTYISLLERGRGQPTLATLLQLAEGIGISPVDLMKKVVEALGAAKA